MPEVAPPPRPWDPPALLHSSAAMNGLESTDYIDAHHGSGHYMMSQADNKRRRLKRLLNSNFSRNDRENWVSTMGARSGRRIAQSSLMSGLWNYRFHSETNFTNLDVLRGPNMRKWFVPTCADMGALPDYHLLKQRVLLIMSQQQLPTDDTDLTSKINPNSIDDDVLLFLHLALEVFLRNVLGSCLRKVRKARTEFRHPMLISTGNGAEFVTKDASTGSVLVRPGTSRASAPNGQVSPNQKQRQPEEEQEMDDVYKRPIKAKDLLFSLTMNPYVASGGLAGEPYRSLVERLVVAGGGSEI